ncbi:hypothetical protein CN980_23670 [Bacillus cereus]|uniref:Uncharacterized protein n=1 Tax=Bacillus cereus TaxID=1396 RepID=A0A9X7C7W7_BACCE|nr:hypothetical protein [Bacillus cereus]PGO65608.1 hypothetical protein CN980_23670 [Bacillus cereus]
MEDTISIQKQDFSIECEICSIPCDKNSDIHGGFVLTGMINIENIITIKKQHKKKHLFLEKKLPFQVLIMDLGEDCYAEKTI